MSVREIARRSGICHRAYSFPVGALALSVSVNLSEGDIVVLQGCVAVSLLHSACGFVVVNRSDVSLWQSRILAASDVGSIASWHK